MSIYDGLLFLNLAATGFMASVIWFVQVVHYPLMQHYTRESFADVCLAHQRLTQRVVIVPMLLEVVTSIGLVIAGGSLPTWIGLILTGVTGFTTVLVSVPLHENLAKAWDAETHRKLCRTNWLRTAGWTLHAGLLLGMVMAK
jgi:hypothetical protein